MPTVRRSPPLVQASSRPMACSVAAGLGLPVLQAEPLLAAMPAMSRCISKSLPLNLYNITQVELTVSMAAEPGKPARQVPVRITHPNSCSLKYDELDLKLRDMLEASGIEPKEPQEAQEPAEA